MSKVISLVGLVWALPLTLLGLFHVLLPTILGWYQPITYPGLAWVWSVNPSSPTWLRRAWGSRSGCTLGNTVIINVDHTSRRGQMVLRHEQEHVNQHMRLGVLQPVLYNLFSLIIWLACPLSSPYYSNVFEIEARRAAGQVVDVEGTLKRLRDKLDKQRS